MCLQPKLLYVNNYDNGYTVQPEKAPVLVPCGKCIECVQAYSRSWSLRVMLEARQHKENCVVTLTYNDEHLPKDGELSKRDVQLFFKRLRKYLGVKSVRYFYCGEYGDRYSRPHYHVILFGWKPNDLEYFYTTKKGSRIYKSEIMKRLWSIPARDPKTGKILRNRYGKVVWDNIGFADVGELTYETAWYCTKYLQKLLPRPHVNQQAYLCMSRRPGIGATAVTLPQIANNSVYLDGRRYKLPRYFLERIKESDPDIYWGVKKIRAKSRALKRPAFRSECGKLVFESEYLRDLRARRVKWQDKLRQLSQFNKNIGKIAKKLLTSFKP